MKMVIHASIVAENQPVSDLQLRRCGPRCQKNGRNIIGEKGEYGSDNNVNRAGLNELGRILASDSVEIIAVNSADRLSRIFDRAEELVREVAPEGEYLRLSDRSQNDDT